MFEFLQWFAGGMYLLNKVFFSFSEHAERREKHLVAERWTIAAWSVYLAGLIPWVVIFIRWHNWIAAFLEASGAPSMVLGLWLAVKRQDRKKPRWLDYLAFVAATTGVVCSVYDFGGLNTLRQWLEIVLTLGFLVGTYQLAHKRAGGYLWYVLMHVSCGLLFYVQHSPWLVVQQVVSLMFIVDAYITKNRTMSRVGEKSS